MATLIPPTKKYLLEARAILIAHLKDEMNYGEVDIAEIFNIDRVTVWRIYKAHKKALTQKKKIIK